MFYRLKVIIKKELRQIKRDPRTLYLIFVLPLFLLVLMGYAISFDVKNIRIAIYDQDKSTESREFIRSLQSSDYFHITSYIDNSEDVGKMLDKKLAQCVIVIPLNFSEKIQKSETGKIQFLIDG